MELRSLRYFLTVAEELHFGRAAKRLCIAQPSLSAQIKKLEDELGGKLFWRDRKGVRLTDGGRLLMPAAQKILGETAETESLVRTTLAGSTGILRLGYMNTAYSEMFRRILKTFRLRYPQVRIHLQEESPANLFESLRIGEIDAAFVNLLDPPHLDDLAAEHLSTWQLQVLLPAEHPLAARESISLDSIMHEPIIEFGQEYFRGLRLFDSLKQEPDIVHVTGNLQVMAGLVSAGLGITFVPTIHAPFLPEDVVLKPVEGLSSFLHGLLVHRQNVPEPLVRNFLESVHIHASAANLSHEQGRGEG